MAFPANKIRDEVIGWLGMLVGCCLYALGTMMFVAPCGIVSGGITGLATLVHLLDDRIPIGMASIVLNIPVFILGLIFVGKKCSINFVFTIVFLGVITDLFGFVPKITENILIASVCGGILCGLGSGLFLRNGFNAGTELLGRIMSKIIKTQNVPLCVGVCDAFIVLLGFITFRDFNTFFYAIVVVFFCAKTSGVVSFGLKSSKLCYVISDKGEEIAKALIAGSKRGITMLRGVGMYTADEHQILMTCIYNRQIVFLKKTIKEIDENAFVVVTPASEVHGKGFSKL